MPDNIKIDTLKNFPTPTNIRELRSFLGLANHVREFIPKFSQIAKPLFDKLKGESKKSKKTVIVTEKFSESFKT